MPVTPDAAPHLRAAGHDAIHAVDLGLARSSDNELLTVARREERVIITADLDYPRLIALEQARPSRRHLVPRRCVLGPRDACAARSGLGPRVHTRPRTFNRCRRSQAHPSPRPAYQQVTGNARQRGESVVSTTRRTAAASTRRRNLTISAPEGRSASAQFRFSSMQRIRFDNRALRYSATFRAT